MMKRRVKWMAVVLSAVLAAGALGGCSSKEDGDASVATKYPDKAYGFQLEKPVAGDKIAVMHTSMGDISIRFFPEAVSKRK